jgi:L-ascorbate metabolism protein UlaG (beta-lactamase superfamily)
MPYPLSDHFDGALFFNPEPTIRRANGKKFGLLSIIRARWKRDPSVWSTWPAHIENAVYPAPEQHIAEGSVGVTFIGHSTFLLRLPGLNVLTDPIFSKRCSPVKFAGPARVRAPGIALEDLPKIDMVLLSHNHYDHCDLASLRQLRRRFAHMRIVTSLGNAAFLAAKRIKGAIELDWWQANESAGTRITAVPARHFAARSLSDRNKTLWAGFVLEHGGTKIYFAGDTGYTKFFKEIAERLGPPDLALLPIGAYEPRWFMGPVHMNPEDAVKAFTDLGARRAIGMHFGTFQLTAEAIDAPLQDLAAAKEAASIAPEAFTTLDCGETETVSFEPATSSQTAGRRHPPAPAEYTHDHPAAGPPPP